MGLVILVALFLPWLMPALDQWTRAAGIAGANVRVRRHFSTHTSCRGCSSAALLSPSARPALCKRRRRRRHLVLVAGLRRPFRSGLCTQHRRRCAHLAADARAHRLRYPRSHPGRRHRLGLGPRASGEAACLTLTAAGVVWALCLATLLPLHHLLTPQASFGHTLVEELWWSAFAVILVPCLSP